MVGNLGLTSLEPFNFNINMLFGTVKTNLFHQWVTVLTTSLSISTLHASVPIYLPPIT